MTLRGVFVSSVIEMSTKLPLYMKRIYDTYINKLKFLLYNPLAITALFNDLIAYMRDFSLVLIFPHNK